MKELCRTHRPTTFKDVVGQPEAVKVLTGLLKKPEKFPHAILLSGPSGCGKTTIARIIRRKINCAKIDFAELDCADFRGIETVREVRRRLSLQPLGGDSRLWLIDEAHKLTNDAQTALLKNLEEPPAHAYFIIATTDPQKLISTIHTRVTHITLRAIGPKDMAALIARVLKAEGAKLSEEVVERLVDASEGSARKALVILHQIIEIEDEEDQLEAISRSDASRQAIEIARALFRKAPWGEVAKILKGLKDEEPESLRHLILGYATTILLSGGKQSSRAAMIIDTFRDNWYDCKRAGLVASCYEVTVSK